MAVFIRIGRCVSAVGAVFPVAVVSSVPFDVVMFGGLLLRVPYPSAPSLPRTTVSVANAAVGTEVVGQSVAARGGSRLAVIIRKTLQVAMDVFGWMHNVYGWMHNVRDVRNV